MLEHIFHQVKRKVKHPIAHLDVICPDMSEIKKYRLNDTKSYDKDIRKSLKRKGSELISGNLILIPARRVIELLNINIKSFKKLNTAQEENYFEAYRNKNKQGKYYIEYNKVIFKSVGDKDYAIIYNNPTEFTYLDLKEYFFLKNNNFKILGRVGMGKESMIVDTFSNNMIGFVKCKQHSIKLSLITKEFEI